jgi:hypothetical protein
MHTLHREAAMFGIIIEVNVDLNREAEAIQILHEVIVPRARGHEGFVSGYWLRAVDGNLLTSVQIFESLQDAQAAAARIQTEGPPPGAPVTLASITTYQVLATA